MARAWVLTAALLLAAGGLACGDDHGPGSGAADAGPQPDVGGRDAAMGIDARPDQDAATARCGASVPVTRLPSSGQVTGSIAAGPGELASATCGGAGAEAVHEITVDTAIALAVSLDTAGDAVLYLRSDCLDQDSEVACDERSESLFIDRLEPGNYYLVVDGASPDSAVDFELETVAYIPHGELCDIGADRCAPGLVCDTSVDSPPTCVPSPCEADPVGGDCELALCSDGVDNDGDAIGDFPLDPGCSSAEDETEEDGCPGELCPRCANGLDDDRDGGIDYPDDRDCASASQGIEQSVVCRNGLDEDGDGLVDGQDPGCLYSDHDSEVDDCPAGPTCPACSDDLDNDGDGEVDWPEEPGCTRPVDPDELDTCPDAGCAACSNGQDDDADGNVDYPADPDCVAASWPEGFLCPGWDPYIPVTTPIVSGTTAGATDDFSLETTPECGDAKPTGDAPDVVLLLRAPPGLRRVWTDSTGSDRDTIVAIYNGCDWIEGCEEFGETSTSGVNLGPYVLIVVDGRVGPVDYTIVVQGEIEAGWPCDQEQISSGLLHCEAPTSCLGGYCR